MYSENVFLPPSCTRLLLPLDQEILGCAQAQYRKLTIRKLIMTELITEAVIMSSLRGRQDYGQHLKVALAM